MDDPRHVFLSAGEVIARYGWGKTKGYQLRVLLVPRRYRFHRDVQPPCGRPGGPHPLLIVSKLLDEIEAQLTGSTPGHEAVRTAAQQIRDEFDLADTPLEDVADFPALRDRLKDLVVAPERVQS